jgi:hypothetical protein
MRATSPRAQRRDQIYADSSENCGRVLDVGYERIVRLRHSSGFDAAAHRVDFGPFKQRRRSTQDLGQIGSAEARPKIGGIHVVWSGINHPLAASLH